MAFRTVLEFLEDLPKLRSWDNNKTKEWIRDVVSSCATGMENTANTIQISTVEDPTVFNDEYPYRCIEFIGSGLAAVAYQSVPINQTMSFKEIDGGGGAHSVELLNGTFDGLNNLAQFSVANQCLIVHFDSNRNGTILANAGNVLLFLNP